MQVKGILRRAPFSHSQRSHSEYTESVDCAEFLVKKVSYDDTVEVTVFFPSRVAPEQGVELSLPSPKNSD